MSRSNEISAPPAGHFLTRDFVRSLPPDPGVYLFRDRAGEVVYVGKAANLRNRVASYRAPAANLPRKTVVMLGRAASLETIITATEKEALLLEASLIKKHRPRYNVILKDDKNYPYLKLTVNEEWPRLVLSRRRRADGARYFGPFASAGALRETMRLLGRVFPLRKCRTSVMRNQSRPCLDYQMQRCLGPCCSLADKGEYKQVVMDLIDVLEGRNRKVEHRLEKEMAAAAAELAFEKAAVLRDRLDALRRTLERQAVVTGQRSSFDIFFLVSRGGKSVVALIRVRGGMISGRLDFFLPDAAGTAGEIMSQVLHRFYAEDREVPPELLLSDLPDDRDSIESWLGEVAAHRVRISVPARGGRRRLLAMAETNGVRILEERLAASGDWKKLSGRIRETLNLGKTPSRIECVDISNTGGRQAVGSMVCFTDGVADKANYRHYNIRLGDDPDDYGMMREVVERRILGDRAWPDLLLLDGGRGQLGVIVPLLRRLGAEGKIALAAIAKGRGRGADRIFVPGAATPLELDASSAVLLFFMRIRDEAHRFGVSHHRRRRQRATMSSRLDAVKGLGPVKKKALLAAFGSVKGISRAGVGEIAAVKGVNRELAARILASLGQSRPAGED